MKLKRKTFIDIVIALMWIALCIIVAFFLCFPKAINERLYYRIMESVVTVWIVNKLLYWICGKIDKYERGKNK